MSSSPQSAWIDLYTRLRSSPEQWDRALWQFACELRVAMPAVVTTVNDNGTVNVQLAVLENLLINSTSTPVAIPELQDVRVLMMRAGGVSLTLPIQVGDECLVVFLDLCSDSWEQSGGTENVQMGRRRHDLSDAVAIFGIWNQTRNLTNYSSSSAQLRSDDGNTYLEVMPGAINAAQNLNVENGASGSFMSADGKTVTILNGIVVNLV
jgi:hypothetical protein